MRPDYTYFAIIFCFFLTSAGRAQQLHLNLENQISGWATAGFSDPLIYQFGSRYIPSLSLSDSLRKNRIIDTELSCNAYGNVNFTGQDYDGGNVVIKPYRLWIRYGTPRLEFRFGLQKINFGSAAILRPLMWFDRMDYRDPLQLTDGVYALLGRYYFQKNANIWLWALYGNDETKGWEKVPTQEHTPEFGGRFQLPLGKGEAALSFHHRHAELFLATDTLPVVIQDRYPESRIGLDGKWDLGVGLWFESTLMQSHTNNVMIRRWETYFNFGMDYTLPLGNGLNLTAEYFRYGRTDDLTEKGQHTTYTAVAANYPIGVLNNIMGMVYYNWDQQDWYRFLSLQRIYDYWSFYLMAFWNPDQLALYSGGSDESLFAGKGIQFMVVVSF